MIFYFYYRLDKSLRHPTRWTRTLDISICWWYDPFPDSSQRQYSKPNQTIRRVLWLQINHSKSLLLFLNKDERLTPPIKTPFTNAKNGFTYLGVKITPKVKTIIPSNYDPLMNRVMDTLNHLTVKPISMIGRINIIKMDILPKFFYLYQSLHLPIFKYF